MFSATSLLTTIVVWTYNLNRIRVLIADLDYAEWLMIILAGLFAIPALALTGAGLAAVVGL